MILYWMNISSRLIWSYWYVDTIVGIIILLSPVHAGGYTILSCSGNLSIVFWITGLSLQMWAINWTTGRFPFITVHLLANDERIINIWLEGRLALLHSHLERLGFQFIQGKHYNIRWLITVKPLGKLSSNTIHGTFLFHIRELLIICQIHSRAWSHIFRTYHILTDAFIRALFGWMEWKSISPSFSLNYWSISVVVFMSDTYDILNIFTLGTNNFRRTHRSEKYRLKRQITRIRIVIQIRL